ncbi:helix-turn-helix domain-containing protein [Microbacterium oleivorans]
MAKEYEEGATIREPQGEHNLSQGAVARALHRSGVQMRPRAPRRCQA